MSFYDCSHPAVLVATMTKVVMTSAASNSADDHGDQHWPENTFW